MKKFITLIMIMAFLSMGCATTSNVNYKEYVEAKKVQIREERKPLVSLTLSTEGRVEGVIIYPQPRHINIEQKKESPAWKLAGSIVRVFGITSAIWATGDAITDIVGASTGSTSINSGNNNSANEGTISQDYSIVDTVSTETITTTGVE